MISLHVEIFTTILYMPCKLKIVNINCDHKTQYILTMEYSKIFKVDSVRFKILIYCWNSKCTYPKPIYESSLSFLHKIISL